MVKKSVKWTHTAIWQRRQILKYWHERTGSKKYSEKILKLSNDRIEILKEFFDSFVETDFPDTRVSAMGHFSIFYKVKKTQLIITAF